MGKERPGRRPPEEAFQTQHRGADDLRETLRTFDIDAGVERRANAQVAAIVSTPKGELELG